MGWGCPALKWGLLVVRVVGGRVRRKDEERGSQGWGATPDTIRGVSRMGIHA